MTIRHTVQVGQEWQSNDPRRFDTVVRVVRILGYESGQELSTSRVGDSTPDANRNDRVHVENLRSGKRSIIRRDQFLTGVRGWSLTKEASHVA